MRIEDLLGVPQLGEFVWHQQTQDTTIDDMSQRHLATLRALAREIRDRGPSRQLRVLELGAYRHYSGHLLAQELGADVWLSDISVSALEWGRDHAQQCGVRRLGEICAADFHDLPFADAYFDIVFIASAVHHTRHTEQVLREMARVTRPDGLLWLENEPVGRAACLYLYNSNRPESYTRREQAYAASGLLRFVSSPFHGTRPEEIFAMVENDRIPIDLFLAEFQRAGTIDYLHLETGATCQALETRLESICDRYPNDAVVRLATLLSETFDGARTDDWVADTLGFREPTLSEIYTLAQRFADASQAVRAATDAATRQHARARLYGAALQAKIRRGGKQAEATTAMRRRTTAVRGCSLDADGPSGAAFMGMRAQFPDVQNPAQETETRALFGELGWTTVTEAFGAISLVNLAASARLPQPAAGAAILLLRVYAVPLADAPYKISVRQGHRLVTEAIVAQAESRLLRGLVYADAGDIVVEHFDARGRPLTIASNLHISVLQMLSPAAE